MKFILGTKLGMGQFFKDTGEVVPLTLVNAGPLVVTQIKTKEKDGYEAVQVGFGSKKEKNIRKPQRGHLKKVKSKNENVKTENVRWLREFKAEDGQLQLGDVIDASVFSEGDMVKVSGISKGKGFQGAVKRHGFHGMPASHGHKHVQRHVGSIGQRFPQHTLKGMRMAGHMGAERISVRGLEIVKVDKVNNILGIKGVVPGRKGTLLEIISIK